MAWCVASTGHMTLVLLTLLALMVWGLGTRGVPLTVDIAQKLMGDKLTVTHSAGGWFGPIQLEGIVFDSKASHIEIDRLRLDWSLAALWHRTLRIDQLEVGSVIVQQKAHEAKPPEPLQPTLPINLLVTAASVEHFELRPVQGAAFKLHDLQAKASWLKDTVMVESLQLSHADTGRVQATASITLAPQSIRVQSLQFTGPATVTGEGLLGLMGTPSALKLHLQNGRWPLLTAPQVRVPTLDANLSGVLTGDALDAALTLKGVLRTAVDAKALGFDLDTALQLQSHGARIERLSLRSTDGAGSLSAQGEAEWQPALRLEATAELIKLDPGVLLPAWKGQLNGSLKASSTLIKQVPVVQFTAALKNSQLRGYPLQMETRGSAALQGETRQLTLDEFLLSSGGTTLQASGKLLPLLDAQLSVDASDLKTLLPSLAGAVQLKASAQGAPTAPTIQASGSASGLRYGEHRIAAAQLALDFSPKAESSARLTATGLQIGSTKLASASVVAEGRVERHSITLQASVIAPKSAASLTLVGAADLKTRRWQGSLQQSSFTPPYGPVWQQQAPGALVLAAAQQQLEATCWRGGTARLCLQATLAAPLTRVAYRLENLDTAAFAALLPPDWQLQTVLNGRGLVELNGTQPQTLDLDLTLSEGRIVIPGSTALQLLPSSLQLQQLGPVWQGKAALLLDRGSLQVEATLPVVGGPLIERPISGNVLLDIPDLAWASTLLPKVQDLRGAVTGRFVIDGNAGAPRLAGALNLSNGSLKVPSAGIVLKDITAEVRGGNTGVLSLNARASSGGTVNLSGTADFASGQPVVQLKITGEDLQVADIADARVWVSPDLVYAQDAEGMTLTGSVKVPKADITPRRLAANAIGASADQVLVGADAPVTKTLPLSAEVTLLLGDKVTFEGFGLKSRITGNVTAIDRPGSGGTRGRGELRLIDAAYKAYGQEIKVETGRILFNGGPIAEPTVDLVARRSPREDVTVSLHVRGTLDQPTFDLTSSPAMPREQQLGWLIFGRPIDSGAGGELSGAAAALSLGIAGGDALASRLGKVIGLDQVSLGADSSNAWQASGSKPSQPGTDQTRFTVGKYLSPKLFVSYGVGLFDNGNVLRLLYDLGHGIKLRTEAGLETGGDLLYTVEH